jgi:assimilatory nitrate reductase catalytic subunit
MTLARGPIAGRSVAGVLGIGRRSPDPAYQADDRGGVMNVTRKPDHWVRTTCGYCSVGCGMLLGVRDGKAVSVMGDPDHPVNEGRLCPKGLAEHQTIDVDGRLTRPLVRRMRGGVQQPASWDDAIAKVVGGFRDAVECHGPDAVAVLSTGQLVTEEFYALGKLVRAGLGIRHYDGNTTLCMASAAAGYKRTFGSDGPPGAYADLDRADCILLVGANVADNHPLLAPRVLGNRSATVIVVDPRVTKTAMMADLHLAIRPRTDITLLNGMIKIVIEEGLVDVDYVAAHTEGFAELAAHVASYDLARVAAECGVEPLAVRQAALAFGHAKRATAAWTMGVNHSVQGTETVTLLNTLCLITGNIGKEGASPFSITGQCNAMGTREAGSTASLPGYRAWEDEGARAEVADLWGLPVDRLPSARGRAYPDIIDGVLDGTITALWVIATNPPVSFPNRARLERAFAGLDLLVVQDGYATPTTALADVVLPAAVWGEKDGTYTNSERRVSRVRKAVEPPGLARSDFDIFLAVAEAAGVADDVFPGWKGPEDAFVEWTRVSAGRLCDYSGITWDRIDAAGGVQWPCLPDTPDPAGTPRLYADGGFPTPSGKAKLWCVSGEPVRDAPNQHFPFLLNTGRTVEHWHTRTKTGRVDILEKLAPEGWVEVNPADAGRLGVAAGDRVSLESRRGAVDGVVVRVTATVREGEVFVPFHYDEWCVNRLTVDEFDPISREPNYKQSAVRIVPK